MKFVHQLNDGTFAVYEWVKVNDGITIGRPVDEKRYQTEFEAQLALSGELPEPIRIPVQEPEQPKATPQKGAEYRITKLEKGVFAVEMWETKTGKWVEVATKKTRKKAQEFIIDRSI